MAILLASASPRRSELLRAARIAFDVLPAQVDESLRTGETAEQYASRLAEAKAWAVAPRAGGRLILAADTVVVADEQILGKPADQDDARRMLRLLSGRSHVVITAITLLGAGGSGPPLTAVERTLVEFAPMSEKEIDWYVASGEPMDKAGAYAIQGLASRFISRIEGSYSNVVGLPVALAYALMKEFGQPGDV